MNTKNIDKRIREMIYPVRIVTTYGNVQNAESLLREKDLQITTTEPDCIVLEKSVKEKEKV